jgi:hypothetical protein
VGGRAVLVDCNTCGDHEVWGGDWAAAFWELWRANRSIPCVREGCPGFLVPRHVACSCHHAHPGRAHPPHLERHRPPPGKRPDP